MNKHQKVLRSMNYLEWVTCKDLALRTGIHSDTVSQILYREFEKNNSIVIRRECTASNKDSNVRFEYALTKNSDSKGLRTQTIQDTYDELAEWFRHFSTIVLEHYPKLVAASKAQEDLINEAGIQLDELKKNISELEIKCNEITEKLASCQQENIELRQDRDRILKQYNDLASVKNQVKGVWPWKK